MQESFDAMLKDAAATESLGGRLATHLRGGMVVTLSGDLGAGKTTLVRGMLRSLGVSGAVKSPSYALVEEYSFATDAPDHSPPFGLSLSKPTPERPLPFDKLRANGVHQNNFKFYFYHFDFYRIKDPSEWDSGGFSEYFRDDAVAVIEWPEKLGDRLPPTDLAVHLTLPSDVAAVGRQVRIVPHSEAGAACLSAMKTA